MGTRKETHLSTKKTQVNRSHVNNNRHLRMSLLITSFEESALIMAFEVFERDLIAIN